MSSGSHWVMGLWAWGESSQTGGSALWGLLRPLHENPLGLASARRRTSPALGINGPSRAWIPGVAALPRIWTLSFSIAFLCSIFLVNQPLFSWWHDGHQHLQAHTDLFPDSFSSSVGLTLTSSVSTPLTVIVAKRTWWMWPSWCHCSHGQAWELPHGKCSSVWLESRGHRCAKPADGCQRVKKDEEFCSLGPTFVFRFLFFGSFFWPCHAACGILVPQPGVELVPPAVEVQSINHWTAREFPYFLKFLKMLFLWEVCVHFSDNLVFEKPPDFITAPVNAYTYI